MDSKVRGDGALSDSQQRGVQGFGNPALEVNPFPTGSPPAGAGPPLGRDVDQSVAVGQLESLLGERRRFEEPLSKATRASQRALECRSFGRARRHPPRECSRRDHAGRSAPRGKDSPHRKPGSLTSARRHPRPWLRRLLGLPETGQARAPSRPGKSRGGLGMVIPRQQWRLG